MTDKKKEESQDFLAVIKLVSGEEIISTVTSCEEDDRTLLLLDNPVMFENVMIRNNGVGAIKVIPWVQAATDTILILDMDKVITMSEVFDKEVIRIYNRYMTDKDRETNESIISKDMGYLSSVTEARIFLEKLYKRKNNS
jgi:hypothetical protein|tara:strand:+ start:69 stop:488 length:420 start_codon:yes stop_codon:yes gene_type:complete